MSRGFARRDRTARLLGLAHLLNQHPHGLTAREIAERVGMNVRTVQRDLRALEEEVGVTCWQEKTRYGVERQSLLPSLDLTLEEAVTVFLSVRLMTRYQDYRDRHVLGAFGKLATILPSPIAQHAYAAVASLAGRASDEHRDGVFDILARAWAEQRQVRIWYPSRNKDGERGTVHERRVSPYFLEPNLAGHTRYLIGKDALSGQVRTFRVERIERVEPTDVHFEVPIDFDVQERLRHAWGISDEDLVQVRLRFHGADASARARQSRWHPSQREKPNQDGTLDLTFEVGGLLEITPWVLSWGDAVEVLSPPELRIRVAEVARCQLARYS